ncbi:MAG: GreA/GreB family elongation factor [Peptoniphilus harei]|nr:GreA/GreB family elongation factor [Peptoniphilus harei]
MSYKNSRGKSRYINLLKAESYFDNFVDQDTEDKKSYVIQDFEGRCSVGTYFLIESIKDKEKYFLEIVKNSEQDYKFKLSPDNATAIKLSRTKRGEYIQINGEFYKIINIGHYDAGLNLGNIIEGDSSYCETDNTIEKKNKDNIKTNGNKKMHKYKKNTNKDLNRNNTIKKKLNIGDTFKLKDLETGEILDFKIVEELDEDISRNKISNDYLLAIEVANSKRNELIKIQGNEKFKILQINNPFRRDKKEELNNLENKKINLKIGDAFKLENIKTNAIEEYEVVEDERENERLNLLSFNSELVKLVNNLEIGEIIKVPSELFFEKYKIIDKGYKPLKIKKVKSNEEEKSLSDSKKEQVEIIKNTFENKQNDTIDISEILELKEKRFEVGSYFKVLNIYNKKKYKYSIVERKRQNYKYRLVSPDSELAIEVANGKVGDMLKFKKRNSKYINTYKITYINGTYAEVENPYGNKRLNIGTIIKLMNLATKEIQYYMIVKKSKVDLKNRFITDNTPLSLTVANHEIGDIIEVKKSKYKILNITNNVRC